MDGLAERYNNEGDVDERGASVRNGVERRAETTVGQARCGETWMTCERCARCGVLFTPPVAQLGIAIACERDALKKSW